MGRFGFREKAIGILEPEATDKDSQAKWEAFNFGWKKRSNGRDVSDVQKQILQADWSKLGPEDIRQNSDFLKYVAETTSRSDVINGVNAMVAEAEKGQRPPEGFWRALKNTLAESKGFFSPILKAASIGTTVPVMLEEGSAAPLMESAKQAAGQTVNPMGDVPGVSQAQDAALFALDRTFGPAIEGIKAGMVKLGEAPLTEALSSAGSAAKEKFLTGKAAGTEAHDKLFDDLKEGLSPDDKAAIDRWKTTSNLAIDTLPVDPLLLAKPLKLGALARKIGLSGEVIDRVLAKAPEALNRLEAGIKERLAAKIDAVIGKIEGPLEAMQRAPVGGRGMEGGVGPRKPKFAARANETATKMPPPTYSPEEVKAQAAKRAAEGEAKTAETKILSKEEVEAVLKNGEQPAPPMRDPFPLIEQPAPPGTVRPKAPKSRAEKLREQAALAKEAAAEAESKGNVAAKEQMLKRAGERTAEANALEPMPQPDQKAFIDKKIADAKAAGTLDEVAKVYAGDDIVDQYARRAIEEAGGKVPPPATFEKIVEESKMGAKAGRGGGAAAPPPAPPNAPEPGLPGGGGPGKKPKGTPKPIEIEGMEDILGPKPKPPRADVDVMKDYSGPNTRGVPIEESRARIEAAEGGIKGPSLGERIAAGAKSFWRKATRQFEFLPSGKHGALKFALNKVASSSMYANGEAQRFINKSLGGLSRRERSAFAKKVMFNDLMHDVQVGKQLPFGLDEKTFFEMKKEVDAAMPHLDAKVAEENKIVRGLTETLVQEAEKAGVDLSFLRYNQDYFRHQVLEHMGERMAKPGHTGASATGSLKERFGYGGDINAHYAQARFETVQKLIRDAEWFRMMQTIQATEDIAPKLLREAVETGKRLESIVPEGYVTRDYLGERYRKFIAPTDAATFDVLSQISNGEDAARILGAKPMVLPENVAKTMDAFFEATKGKAGLLRQATGAWKWWRLSNPKSVSAYHLRNASGDIEAVLNHPAAFGEVKGATREAIDAIALGKDPSPEFAEWMKRGGMSTFERIQELQQLGKMKEFEQIASDPSFLEALTSKATKPFKKYKEYADIFGDVRESILRYADYRATLKELQESGGVFKTHAQYGASLKEEVDAISDIRDKAFKISNERMGAYDTMTVLGKNARETWLPFWSWREANAKRTYGILRNAFRDGRAGGIAAALGKTLGAKSVGVAVATGRAALKLALPTALLAVYNKTVHGDIEKELPDYTRNTPHLIIGRDSDGRPRVLTGVGAFGDLLGWVGLDSNAGLVRDWANGRASLKDVVAGIAKSPVNVLSQQLNPAVKAVATATTGKDFYPDAFHPRQVRDTAQFLFNQIALAEEYNALAKIPQEGGYLGTWRDVLFKKIDPGASAYNEIRSTAYRFLDKKGVGKGGSGEYDDQQNRLYYHKLALRYGDREKADYWKNKYLDAGGSESGIQKSIDAMSPLKPIPKDLRDEFLDSLDAAEKERLERAEKFWDEILSGKALEEKEAAANAERAGLTKEGPLPSAPAEPLPSKWPKKEKRFGFREKIGAGR